MLQASDVIEALGPDPIAGFWFKGEPEGEFDASGVKIPARDDGPDGYFTLEFQRGDTLAAIVAVTRAAPLALAIELVHRHLREFAEIPFDHDRAAAVPS